jgi:FkbM family methyltransferase
MFFPVFTLVTFIEGELLRKYIRRQLKFILSFHLPRAIHFRRFFQNLRQYSFDLNRIRENIEFRRTIYIGQDTLLVRMKWGAWLAVDSQNIDQLVGLVANNQWEPATTHLLIQNLEPGGKYVNVGTSYGYYACLLGVFGGPNSLTYCFEANPYMIPYLLKSCYWTGAINQVRIKNRAVSNVHGDTIQISFMRQFSGGGGGVDDPVGKALVFDNPNEVLWHPDNLHLIEDADDFINSGTGLYNQFRVKTTTLDQSIPDGNIIDLIKMDIEGMESQAILGAKNVISRSPNILLIIEHSSYVYSNGSQKSKEHLREAWDFLISERFMCFRINPSENYTDSISINEVTSWEEWIDSSHGDFAFKRQELKI